MSLSKTNPKLSHEETWDRLVEARELLYAGSQKLGESKYGDYDNFSKARNAFLAATGVPEPKAKAAPDPRCPTCGCVPGSPDEFRVWPPIDVPTPPEGYELLPRGDHHMVQPGELFTNGTLPWMVSVNITAEIDFWYCYPIAKLKPKPLPRLCQYPSRIEISGTVNALIDIIEVLQKERGA